MPKIKHSHSRAFQASKVFTWMLIAIISSRLKLKKIDGLFWMVQLLAPIASIISTKDYISHLIVIQFRPQ